MTDLETQRKLIQDLDDKKLSKLVCRTFKGVHWTTYDGKQIYDSIILMEHIARTNNKISDLQEKINILESRIDFLDGSYDD
jgi:hypothetical protein